MFSLSLLIGISCCFIPIDRKDMRRVIYKQTIFEKKVTPSLFFANSLVNKTASHSITKFCAFGKGIRYLTEGRSPFELVNALFGEIFLKFPSD